MFLLSDFVNSAIHNTKSSKSSSHLQRQRLEHVSKFSFEEEHQKQREILPKQGLSNGLNEQVEKAIQSTVDQVSPCPIEPEDGNKGEEKEESGNGGDDVEGTEGQPLGIANNLHAAFTRAD